MSRIMHCHVGILQLITHACMVDEGRRALLYYANVFGTDGSHRFPCSIRAGLMDIMVYRLDR